MKKSEPSHNLEARINLVDCSTSGRCLCVAGVEGYCHHVDFFALICTRMPQKWSIPREKKVEPKQAIATSTNSNFDRMDVKQIKAFISLQVFKSPLTANLNLFSCLKQFIDLFMDLPTEPDFESESIDECLSRCLTPLAGQKLLDPFQMASLPNDFSQLTPFGLMGIFLLSNYEQT